MRRAALVRSGRAVAILLVSGIAALTLVITPPVGARADTPPEHDTGNCGPAGFEGWVCEGSEGESSDDPTPGKTTPAKGSKPVCTEDGEEVPCKNSRGETWNGRCYASVVDPPPAKSDPVWKGHGDGVIMTCVLRIEACDQSAGVHLPAVDCVQQWWAPAPEGSIDVEQIAREAFARAKPAEIPIGIVPENKPGSIGIVGMPVWMWVQDPGTHTTGPLTATAPAGSATVTSTGRVTSIDWNMGDGTTITCHGDGTAYQDSYGNTDSPDCGHRYTKQGNPHTVTATSHWVVEWHGAGQSGTFTLDRTSTTQITVGEAQVITQ